MNLLKLVNYLPGSCYFETPDTYGPYALTHHGLQLFWSYQKTWWSI